MKCKKIWLYGCIILVAIIIGYFMANRGISVDLAKATSGKIEQYVEETGAVKSRSSRTVYIESAGRVAEVLVEKGDLIAQGSLLLTLDPMDRRLAAINAEQTANNYDLAIKDWEKIRKLYAGGIISRKEYETAEVAWKNAAKIHQAAILELERATRNMMIRAPRAGVILDRLVDPNLYAPPGTAAFVIGDPVDLEIETEILADEAVNIQPGNPVLISGKATGDRILRGEVTKIAPMAKNIVSSLGVNQKRRTVTIAFAARKSQLKPGVDIDVKIITLNRPMTVKVPLSAIFDYQGRTHVFRVENGKTALCPVKKGIENDEAIEIIVGLKPGEIILTKPDNTVVEGMKVKVPAELADAK